MLARLVAEFRDATRGPDHAVDLFGAAMTVARLGNPELDPHAYARELDLWAEDVRRHAGGSLDPEVLCQAVGYQLFHVLGFRGNTADYGDPANSYLDQVIERRTGIPITLSLVFMEVAARVGLRCDGVGFPGHFLVRCGDPERPIFLDPFHQGVRLDEAELLARLRSMELGGVSPHAFLCAVTRRQILQRLLANLRASYRERTDLERWFAAVELALVLEPWNGRLYGERGLLHYRMHRYEEALADLERYAALEGQGSLRAGALRLLGELRARLGREEGGR